MRPKPASARRPRPTGRSGTELARGTRVVTGDSEATVATIVEVAQRVLWIGTAASMGESATAMGRGRAVGPMPASRPTGRSGLGYRVGTALGTHLVPTRVEKPQAQLPVAHKGSLPDLRISAPSGFARILVPRRNRFSTIDERGRWCLREPAHGLRE